MLAESLWHVRNFILLPLVVRFADEGESIFKESEIFLYTTIPKNLIVLMSVCSSWQERRDGVALTVHDRELPPQR